MAGSQVLACHGVGAPKHNLRCSSQAAGPKCAQPSPRMHLRVSPSRVASHWCTLLQFEVVTRWGVGELMAGSRVLACDGVEAPKLSGRCSLQAARLSMCTQPSPRMLDVDMSRASAAVSLATEAVDATVRMACILTSTAGLAITVIASTSHFLVPGIGLQVAATQTTTDAVLLEETLASTL